MSPTPALRAQVTTFLLVGAIGTVAYGGVYLLLRASMPAHPANITARVLVAVPTTWVNARCTFGSTAPLGRILGGGLAVLAVGTAVSAAPLAVEQALLGPDDRPAELVILVLANVVATAARFVLLRRWLLVPTEAAPDSSTVHRRAVASRPTIRTTGS